MNGWKRVYCRGILSWAFPIGGEWICHRCGKRVRLAK